MYSNLSFLSRKLNVGIYDLLSKAKCKMKNDFRNIQEGFDVWKVNLIRELIYIKERDMHCDLDNVQTNHILDFLCHS